MALKCACLHPLRTISCHPSGSRLSATRRLHRTSALNGKSEHDEKLHETSPTPRPSYDDVSEVDPEASVVKTVVGDLALSPLMNPKYHEAKRKFKQMKG